MRIPDKQAIFFELDGVLVREARLDENDRVPWFEGALDALAACDPSIFTLLIGTNRSDIAFGKLRERDFKRFCTQFLEDCEARGIQIRKIYSCPFHPKGHKRYRKDSVFRKPAPGIYKMAQQEFDLNLSRCWAIGHTTVDTLAGNRAGMGTMLMETGAAGQDGEYHIEPHRTARDLRDAMLQIHEFESAMRC
ncbi:MAG: HAD-IIIA family hydrolase [Planctomycetota bacterium]